MIVTYYYPWGYFHPVRTGADHVAARHLEYFRTRGFQPRVIVANGWSHERRAFERHYHWVEDLIVVDAPSRPEIHRLLDRWDFGSHLAGHAMLAECPDLKKALSQPADLAFMNYVFATPLLDAVPRDAVRVLESYDIMAYQYVKQRQVPTQFQWLLATEFALYEAYDLVLMINEQEEAYAKARCRTNVTYVARAIDVVADQAPTSTRNETYELLFVGSGYHPNIEGVHWFYTNVFTPWLKPEGVRWAIAGGVCKHLSFQDPMVVSLGVVDDLADVYRRSKVVVVPLFRGSGISLKTLEAMGQRKPVVTTPCGRRGLGAAADDALICNSFQEDPREVADAILSLCSSQPMRQEYGRRAAAYIDTYFGAEAYGRRMDELLAPFTAGHRQEQQIELQDDHAAPQLRVAA